MNTFNEYFEKMKEDLPQEAISTLPMLISKETKQRMMTYPPSFIAGIIKEAINEINHGSIEKIETLIRKRI